MKLARENSYIVNDNSYNILYGIIIPSVCSCFSLICKCCSSPNLLIDSMKNIMTDGKCLAAYIDICDWQLTAWQYLYLLGFFNDADFISKEWRWMGSKCHLLKQQILSWLICPSYRPCTRLIYRCYIASMDVRKQHTVLNVSYCPPSVHTSIMKLLKKTSLKLPVQIQWNFTGSFLG